MLVVGVVPGIGLLRRRLLGFGLLRLLLLAGWSSSVGTSSSRVLDHLLIERSDSSSVDIGSSLIACCSDGVRMKLLNEFGVEPLLNRHERLTLVPPNLSPIGSRRRGKFA